MSFSIYSCPSWALLGRWCRRSGPILTKGCALPGYGEHMSLLSWIAVGLLAGLIARWVVKDDRTGCIYTMVVGVLGAIIGGWLMASIDSAGVNDFSLRSIAVAAIGAVLLLLVLQALAGLGPRNSRRR